MNNTQTNANHPQGSNQQSNGTGNIGNGGPPAQADSPFDLSNFIAFPTANSIGSGNDDLYRSFAQGIKSTSGDQTGNASSSQSQSRPIGNNDNGNGGSTGGMKNVNGPPSGVGSENPYGLDPAAFRGEVRFQVSPPPGFFLLWYRTLG
jgi:hypothetical protein